MHHLCVAVRSPVFLYLWFARCCITCLAGDKKNRKGQLEEGSHMLPSSVGQSCHQWRHLGGGAGAPPPRKILPPQGKEGGKKKNCSMQCKDRSRRFKKKKICFFHTFWKENSFWLTGMNRNKYMELRIYWYRNIMNKLLTRNQYYYNLDNRNLITLRAKTLASI